MNVPSTRHGPDLTANMATIPDETQLEDLIGKRHRKSQDLTLATSPTMSSAASARSVEASGPPTPVNGPPQNYDIVAPSLYRSSFPRACNFEYLSSLALRTIITLVSGPSPPEYAAFIKANSIVHHEIPFPAHKAETDCIPIESMTQVLELLQDEANYPILIHCNKGKHRTGCAIACYRLACGQALPDVLEEYRYYAGIKARVLDEQYIRSFDQRHSKDRLRGSSMSSSSARAVYPTPPGSDKGINLV